MYYIITKMRRIYTVFLSCWLLCAIALAAEPVRQEPAHASIGQIVSLQGRATAADASQKTRTLDLKSPVFLNDKIATYEGSKLQILFDDNSIVSQGEKSELTIDEYVYTPKDTEKAKCSLGMAKGMFRVITGEITALNPKRFKAQTRMATIGVRGCDVGFKLQPKREDIYILSLRGGEAVLIERTALDEILAAAQELRENILTIANQGVAITIQEGLKLQERPMTPAEASEIMRVSSSSDSSASGKQGADSPSSATETINNLAEKMSQMEAVEKLIEAVEAEQSLPPLPSGPTERPTPPPPPEQGPPVLVGGHPELTDWEWGLWEDGAVFYSGNRYLGASFLSATEFQNIANGATLYLLTGGGQAGAVIDHTAFGNRKIVQGGCNLEVLVGQSVTPLWGGTFSLNNFDGDYLNFTVNRVPGGGQIAADGAMSLGTLGSYSMMVNGTPFNVGSLTGQRIDGRLIRPASGIPPITAAAGEFHFDHGGAASVHGAFGADLR